MKFEVHDQLVLATWDDSEKATLLRKCLYFKDPTAESFAEFRNGTWDGFRDFFLSWEDGKAAFPSGHLRDVLRAFGSESVSVDLEDCRAPLEALMEPVAEGMLDGITLRDYQVKGVEAALARRKGIIHVAPRGGKTELQIAVVKAVGRKSILLVEKSSLMNQHWERFQERGVREVGRFGDGRKELDQPNLIATFQSVRSAFNRKNDEFLNWIEDLVVAQCDETHHLGSATTYYNTFCQLPGQYRLGYSGTPYKGNPNKGDFHYADFALKGVTGNTIYRVSSKYLRDRGYLVDPVVFFVPISKPSLWHVRNWSVVYKRGISENEERNKAISKLAKILESAGETTLILVKNLKHGEILLDLLREEGITSLMSSGGNRVTFSTERGIERGFGTMKEIKEKVETGEIRTLVGSTIFDEGVDIPSISGLILGSGGKGTVQTIQRAFRAMTSSEGKTESYIFDFFDNTNSYLKNQSSERKRIYLDEELRVSSNLPAGFRRLLS